MLRGIAGLVTAGVLLGAVALNAPPQKAAAPAEKVHWLKLTFGLDDKKVAWDGQATIRGGKILQSAPWSFEKRDAFDPVAHKWFCTTVVLTGRSASSFAEPQRGVLLEIERGDGTQLDVETRAGNFTVDLATLQAGRPQLFLDGRASAELLGTSQPLPDAHVDAKVSTEDDFPSLAIDAAGHRWVAWIGYEDAVERDHLWVLDLDNPRAKVAEIATAREQLNPQLILDDEGKLRLFWSAPQGDNWEIWSAKQQAGGWSAAQRITTAEGTDFHLATARGPHGEVWLAWQAFRNGNSDILVRRLQHGVWSKEIAVANTAANEWEPAIDIDPKGTAWIAYDSYVNGNYDVFLTSLSLSISGRPTQGKTIGVATSADFEAHASVHADDGKVWVAYDAAGPNWGKDYTHDATTRNGIYGEPLHASRRLGLRLVVNGLVVEPAVPLPQKLTKLHPERLAHSDTDEMKRFYEFPQLARDGSGRLVMFFRLNRQGYAGHPVMGAHWELWATTFADHRWLEPILLPPSMGRQNQRVSYALDKDGVLHVAWSTGHHFVDQPQKVRVGRLPDVTGNAADPPLADNVMDSAEKTVEPVVRSWPLHHGDDSYQVYFGDMHRHTDISLCTPTIDGSLVDAYRYALDAVRYDFLAVTDHTRDTDPYPWWRTQKANDLFHVKGTLATIYAYERSNGAPGGGHRNVFFLERGWPVYRSDAHYSAIGEKPPGDNSPTAALYPHLRDKAAFTAAHTPAYARPAMKGTWTYNDPQVEPLTEIFQAYRHDYERPGNPEWSGSKEDGKIAEEASVWYALGLGYKLGFIASSDHFATHTSFACVWAKGPAREQIFDALRARRTYAATDKIILDVRMGDAVMGEEIAAPDVPELAIHVRGTAPISEIQVVRNRTVIWSDAPNKVEVETRFRDEKAPRGAGYYYVRIRQKDGNMAWGSPIWVK